MIFARVLVHVLAASVCGNALSMQTKGVSESRTISRRAREIFQAGLDHTQGKLEDIAHGGIIDAVGDEARDVQELVVSAKTFIQTASSVREAINDPKGAAVQAARDEAQGAVASVAKSLKNAAKVCLIGAVCDGGTLSGTGAAVLYGGGWLVSTISDGMINEGTNQAFEIFDGKPGDKGAFLVAKDGSIHPARLVQRMPNGDLKIEVDKKPREIHRYASKAERARAETRLLAEMNNPWLRLHWGYDIPQGEMAGNKKWARAKTEEMMDMTQEERNRDYDLWLPKYQEFMRWIDDATQGRSEWDDADAEWPADAPPMPRNDDDDEKTWEWSI